MCLLPYHKLIADESGVKFKTVESTFDNIKKNEIQYSVTTKIKKNSQKKPIVKKSKIEN